MGTRGFRGRVLICLLLFCSQLQSAESCTKVCLSDITEQYLEAMLRGSLDNLPLASNLRVTSNSQPVKVGKGDAWKPGITILNRYTFLDPDSRTAIFFGTIAAMPEKKRTWWHYALRLSVDGNGNIFEIEEQSSRGGFQSADQVERPFKEAAIFDAVLPEDERSGEEKLIRVADAYWDGLSSGDVEGPLFSPDCQRTEFGSYSTNNPFTHDARKPNFVPVPKTGKSCRMFFDFGPKFHWPTDNRRYYIVDEPRGVVVGIGQLHQFGKDGIPGITLFEAFKVVNGRIEFLWAPALSWGLEDSGWPDWQRSK